MSTSCITGRHQFENFRLEERLLKLRNTNLQQKLNTSIISNVRTRILPLCGFAKIEKKLLQQYFKFSLHIFCLKQQHSKYTH